MSSLIKNHFQQFIRPDILSSLELKSLTQEKIPQKNFILPCNCLHEDSCPIFILKSHGNTLSKTWKIYLAVHIFGLILKHKKLAKLSKKELLKELADFLVKVGRSYLFVTTICNSSRIIVCLLNGKVHPNWIHFLKYWCGFCLFFEGRQRIPEITMAFLPHFIGLVKNKIQRNKIDLEVLRAVFAQGVLTNGLKLQKLTQFNESFIKPLEMRLFAGLVFGSLLYVHQTDRKSTKRFSLVFDHLWGA